MQEIKKKIAALREDGKIARVLGWEKGMLPGERIPTLMDDESTLVYDGFCAANVSKYLINAAKKPETVLALLKPCDTYSFNQLLTEHRIEKEKVYVLSVPCFGMMDPEKVKALGILTDDFTENGDQVTFHLPSGDKTIKRAEVLYDKCTVCKKSPVAGDDSVTISGITPVQGQGDRFDLINKLENMTPGERFAFWQNELSKCIRCNACRNVCPACSCLTCVFDRADSGVADKVNADDFEENMFHIIRAFHVAGRCTDCGECSRVCPQHIPLHLLNRKFIKDIDTLYGDYQAGAEEDQRNPLVSYTTQDAEPGRAAELGGKTE